MKAKGFNCDESVAYFILINQIGTYEIMRI